MFLAISKKGPPPRRHLMIALGEEGRAAISRFLGTLEGNGPTPLLSLPALAAANGVASIHVKDEGQRLGLKSFKALGGAYAVAMLVLEEAGRRLGRAVEAADLSKPEVRAVAAAVRVLVLTCDVGRVVLGGGVSELGERLAGPVRTRLEHEAAESEFLASMGLARRVVLAPAGVPVGAVGAALLGSKES